jgi:hypothetical protein
MLFFNALEYKTMTCVDRNIVVKYLILILYEVSLGKTVFCDDIVYEGFCQVYFGNSD